MSLELSSNKLIRPTLEEKEFAVNIFSNGSFGGAIDETLSSSFMGGRTRGDVVMDKALAC